MRILNTKTHHKDYVIIHFMIKEIEAKFLSVDKDNIRKMLKEAGFELKIPEYLMRRKTFDFSLVAPGHNRWGRVRQESDKITMSIKEVLGTGINDVHEIELTVNDFNIATAFFEACNIPVKAFQENMREVWTFNDIEVSIDTWPGLNPFVEIEGGDEYVVKEISKKLGFDFRKAIFGSIDIVYEKELGIHSELIIRLPEITFLNPPKNNAS